MSLDFPRQAPVKFPGREFLGQTTDATPLTLSELPIEENQVVSVQGIATVNRTNGVDQASFFILSSAFRSGAGPAQVLGVPSIIPHRSDPAIDLLFVASGNSLLIRAQGVVGKDLNWILSYRILPVQ